MTPPADRRESADRTGGAPTNDSRRDPDVESGRPSRPHTSYLICATARTGSTLLCDALTSTGIVGRPGEYFSRADERAWSARWGTTSYRSFLDRAVQHATTPNGVFGAKIGWTHLGHLVAQVRTLPEYRRGPRSVPDLLAAVFPDVRYVWITRRDKVRQAVSQDKAIQTGIVARTRDEPLAAKPAAFSFARINYLYQRILADEAAWQRYFAAANVTPLTVVYEDLLDGCEATVAALLGYLDVPVPAGLTVGPPRLRKLADAVNDEWVERYHAMRARQPEATLRRHRRLAEWFT